MKSGRDKVFGSFALLAVTAMLMLITLPARIPREPVVLDVPFTIETPGTIAVEIAGESGRNGVYFIPKGDHLGRVPGHGRHHALRRQRRSRRAATLRSATTVTLCRASPEFPLSPCLQTSAWPSASPSTSTVHLWRISSSFPGSGKKPPRRSWRSDDSTGRSARLEELMRVKGIKEKRLEKLRRYLCIGC